MENSEVSKMTRTFFFNGKESTLKISGIKTIYKNFKIECSIFTDNTSGFFELSSDLFTYSYYLSVLGSSNGGQYTSNDIEIFQPINDNINNDYKLNIKAYDNSNITNIRGVLTLTFF